MKNSTELNTIEKREKIQAINKLQKKFLVYAQQRKTAKSRRLSMPSLSLTDEEVLLLIEIAVFAKEAIQGIQTYIPLPSEPQKNELL